MFCGLHFHIFSAFSFGCVNCSIFGNFYCSFRLSVSSVGFCLWVSDIGFQICFLNVVLRSGVYLKCVLEIWFAPEQLLTVYLDWEINVLTFSSTQTNFLDMIFW